MGTVERIGEGLRVGFRRAEFFFKHDTFSPETVEKARRVCVRNQEIIDRWIERGMVSSEEIEELREDDKMQQKYSELMKQVYQGDHITSFQELDSLSLAKKAGWLDYYRKFFERRFNTDLLREEPYIV